MKSHVKRRPTRSCFACEVLESGSRRPASPRPPRALPSPPPARTWSRRGSRRGPRRPRAPARGCVGRTRLEVDDRGIDTRPSSRASSPDEARPAWPVLGRGRDGARRTGRRCSWCRARQSSTSLDSGALAAGVARPSQVEHPVPRATPSPSSAKAASTSLADLVAAGADAGPDRRGLRLHRFGPPLDDSPAASPRQPQWSIATPPAPASATGRQSATRTERHEPVTRGGACPSPPVVWGRLDAGRRAHRPLVADHLGGVDLAPDQDQIRGRCRPRRPAAACSPRPLGLR